MSNVKYHPAHHEFKIIQSNEYGHLIEIPDDSRIYSINPGQRWIQHTIEDSDHPAKIGDIVTLSKYLSERLGVSAAFVSGVRTFKDAKRSSGTRQVELLGIPMCWFGIGHFKEYHGLQKPDHIWGSTFQSMPNAFY